MRRFEEAFDATRLTKPRQVIAVAPAHHRFSGFIPFSMATDVSRA
jgi:hypothetical protein